MKKPIIALIIMLIAAAGSVIGFLAVKNKNDNKKQQEKEKLADNKLFSFDPYSPTKVVFSKGSETYTVELNNDVWELDTKEFSIDQTYIQLVCTYMSNLTADKSYGEITNDKLSMYGLDDPDKIELTEPSGTHTLYVGNVSPTGESYYITADGKNNVYTIDAQHGSVMKLDRLLLKNKKIVPYGLADIKSITTYDNSGEKTCELTYDPESMSWSLPDEYSNLTLDQTKVTSELNALVRLEAEDMLDEKLDDLKKYGFDKPYGKAVLTGLDGSEHEFLVSTNNDDPTYCFALVDGEQVELYYKSDLSITQNKPITYIAKNYIAAQMSDATGFKLDFNGNSDSCTMDIDNNKCTFNGKEISLKNSEAYVALNNLFNSFSVLKLEGTDTKVSPKLESPALSAEFTLSDGGTVKIDLVQTEKDSKSYYVFRDGKYTGAYVDETMLKGRNSLSDFYIKFTKLAGI
ncbi:MAG: DUF4340 domain-containing protein [Ruminococcus sp.]|uniref:DUF4340 domain-containing protein n=1 Tax=Ruminococcus sp. TaxID=41978 RepID=UPI002601125E|nr:DUF4340 domain-containing protein [Ruminococcus sp.]MCR5600542.1 DUF4340 domain-containing protein [Ruminococcus sp.]